MFSHCRALPQPVPALAPLGQTISSSLYRHSHFHTKGGSRLRVKGESGCKSPSPEQGEGFCGICTAPWQGFDVFEASSCYFRAPTDPEYHQKGERPSQQGVFINKIDFVITFLCGWLQSSESNVMSTWQSCLGVSFPTQDFLLEPNIFHAQSKKFVKCRGGRLFFVLNKL